jgi:TrmH family RNA methyltransferase
MLKLAVNEQTRFVIVRPHYPENVGAAARAMKTMGFTELVLVKPGRLARPEHMMAQKMAVKSWDVLGSVRECATLDEALADSNLVVATTSRRGISGVRTARVAAGLIERHVAEGGSAAILFGNEKSGLAGAEMSRSHLALRIPMAADQPSINLAQAVQIVAYELFLAGLEARAKLK